MRGWRGRIGIISPDDGINDDEYWQYLPDGVTVLFTRYTTAQRDLPISPDMVDSYAGLETLRAAAETLRITRPSATGFACNSCSFVRGRGWDIEQAAAIGKVVGGPATTISTAMMQALRLLGVRRVAMCAPYPPAVTNRLERYLVDHGIAVAAWQTAGLETEWQIGNTAPAFWYAQGRAVDRPDADAVLIACGGARTAAILAPLEADLGKPVLSATQVLMWHCLQLAQIESTCETRGTLFARFGRAYQTHGLRMPAEPF